MPLPLFLWPLPRRTLFPIFRVEGGMAGIFSALGGLRHAVAILFVLIDLSGLVVLALAIRRRALQATSRDELVGCTGVVISSRLDASFGEIRIRDKTGHDLRVVCKLQTAGGDRKKRVAANANVVVVEHDGRELWVAPLEEEG
jgi:membrane protein implicated in regulation of membrane protease activity